MIEIGVVMDAPAASRPRRTMLFWNVAVPVPLITMPQTSLVVLVPVSESE
jgi:hypothetical protein